MVHCLTDNTTRTSNEVRFLFKKNHAHMGNKGNAAFMFDHLGCVELTATAVGTDQKEGKTLDALTEAVMQTDQLGKCFLQ
jgi:transcriptional/translational regulatory protein YebC/TACO1